MQHTQMRAPLRRQKLWPIAFCLIQACALWPTVAHSDALAHTDAALAYTPPPPPTTTSDALAHTDAALAHTPPPPTSDALFAAAEALRRGGTAPPRAVVAAYVVAASVGSGSGAASALALLARMHEEGWDGSVYEVADATIVRRLPPVQAPLPPPPPPPPDGLSVVLREFVRFLPGGPLLLQLVALAGHMGVSPPQEPPAVVPPLEPLAVDLDHAPTPLRSALAAIRVNAVSTGWVVSPSMPMAVELWKLAADLGNSSAQVNLAILHSYGLWGVPRNDAIAATLLHFAASGGSLEAAVLLGHRHASGTGAPVSCESAAQYFEVVAASSAAAVSSTQGLALSVPSTGRVRFTPDLLADVKLAEARALNTGLVSFYENSAAQGESGAHIALGHIFLLGAKGAPQDYSRAAEHFAACAEEEEPLCATNLAFLHLHGLGVDRDVVTALEFLQAPVKAGIPSAVNLMGVLEVHGLGVPRNTESAFARFTAAAAAGFLDANYNLGLMHLDGSAPHGRNFVEAATALRTAANGGHPVAQYRLGLMLVHGLGSPANCNAGLTLFRDVVTRFPPSASLALKTGWKRMLQGNTEGALMSYLRAGEAGSEVGAWNAGLLLWEGKVPGVAVGPLPTPAAALPDDLPPPPPAEWARVAGALNSAAQTMAFYARRVAAFLPPHLSSAINRLAPAPSSRSPVDMSVALRLFARASTAGNGHAELALGDAAWEGLGGLTPSLSAALAWYTQSCGHSNSQACFNLGLAHDVGSAKPDFETAKKFYDQAMLVADNAQVGVRPFPVSLALARLAARAWVASAREWLDGKRSSATPSPSLAPTTPTPPMSRVDAAIEKSRLARQSRAQASSLVAQVRSGLGVVQTVGLALIDAAAAASHTLLNLIGRVANLGGPPPALVARLTPDDALLVVLCLMVVALLAARARARGAPAAPVA